MKIPTLKSVVGAGRTGTTPEIGTHPIDRQAVDFGNAIAEHRLAEIVQAAANPQLTPTARLMLIRGIVTRR